MLSPHGCRCYSTSYWSPSHLFTTVTSLLTPQNPSATVCGPGFEPSNHPAQLSFSSSTSALVRSNLLTPIQYVSQSALLQRAATAVSSRRWGSWCAVWPTQIVTQAACHVRAGVDIPAWRGSVYARPVTSRITSYCAQLAMCVAC
jgi:hypothetical protein